MWSWVALGGPPPSLSLKPVPRPLTVLLHGQPGSGLDWQLVVPLIATLPLDATDRPGYDGSPAGGFAAGAAHLLQRTAERKLVLVGYSWGAGVALAAALMRPERIQSLVLLAPVGSPLAVSRADRVLAAEVPARVFVAVMRRAGARFPVIAARAVGSRLDARARRAVSAEVALRDPVATWRAWQVEQRALVRETPGLAARLAELRCPTLVLGGTRDPSVTPAAAADLARRIPGARFREIPTGHLMPVEAPEQVAAAILEMQPAE